VPDPNAGAPTQADAEVAVARLTATSADLRGCAVLGGDGSALAATGELGDWGVAAAQLLVAADAAAGEPVTHAHVGTEDGEVFAVRHAGLALVVASERFALASLMLSDMRSALRELSRAAPVAREAEPAAEAA
jgi:hypothetical protein